jgi:polar amino acid transport system substrate-binding protein
MERLTDGGLCYNNEPMSFMLKYVFLLALVAVVGCSDRSGRPDVDSRSADATRPLIVVTQPTEPPFAYRDSSGAIVGTDIDLARRIAAKMGRGLIVEGIEFSEILPRLKAGTADMGIATITITEARQKDVDFSRPYDMGGACFLYVKGGPKPRMSQVASLRIGVETDTVEDLYLCRHGCDPARFINLVDAVDALKDSKVDAVFSDVPHLKVIAEASGGRFGITPPVTRDRYGIAVNKLRPDVLAAANAVIAEGVME